MVDDDETQSTTTAADANTDTLTRNSSIACPNTTFYWSDDKENLVKNTIQVKKSIFNIYTHVFAV